MTSRLTLETVADKLKLNYVERCVLLGDYTPLRELPSVEYDLPPNVKFDLAVQRAQARRWRKL